MTIYPHLFSPLKINEKYTFKNRIESAPMAFGLIALDPDAADKSFRKLESIARCGAVRQSSTRKPSHRVIPLFCMLG